MTTNETNNQLNLSDAQEVFADYKEYNTAATIGSYRLLKAILPHNYEIKKYSASIFRLQAIQPSLSPDEQRVVYQHYYLDLPYAEIGRRLGISTVRAQILVKQSVHRLSKLAKEVVL